MPNYSFKRKSTGEVFEANMSYEERLELLEKDEDLKSLPSRPAIGYRVLRRKPDDGFRDILRNIKSRHQGSTVNTW